MVQRISEIIRSLAFYAAFYLGTVFIVFFALAALPLNTNLFRRAVVGWSRYHRACVTGLLGIKVVVKGTLPSGEVLVAMKHESFFEAIDLLFLLQRPLIFAKAELVRIPFWGKVGEAYGLIGVERDQGATALRRMIKDARRRAKNGRLLAIFPEGTRIRHGTQAPLQSGFTGLYRLLGRPVVPIAIDSGRLYHHRWKRKGTITISVGETIPTGLSREEIEARVQVAINELNGQAD